MYDDITELASKVDWEGGLYEAAFGYGLGRDVLDRNKFPEFMKLWNHMFDVFEEFEKPLRRLEQLLDGALESMED